MSFKKQSISCFFSNHTRSIVAQGFQCPWTRHQTEVELVVVLALFTAMFFIANVIRTPPLLRLRGAIYVADRIIPLVDLGQGCSFSFPVPSDFPWSERTLEHFVRQREHSSVSFLGLRHSCVDSQMHDTLCQRIRVSIFGQSFGEIREFIVVTH